MLVVPITQALEIPEVPQLLLRFALERERLAQSSTPKFLRQVEQVVPEQLLTMHLQMEPQDRTVGQEAVEQVENSMEQLAPVMGLLELAFRVERVGVGKLAPAAHLVEMVKRMEAREETRLELHRVEVRATLEERREVLADWTAIQEQAEP